MGFEEQGTMAFISVEQGNKGQILRGTGKQRPNFDGHRGALTILGNREHKKRNFLFLFWVNKGTSQFISMKQGNRYPQGRASLFTTIKTMHKQKLTSKPLKIQNGDLHAYYINMHEKSHQNEAC